MLVRVAFESLLFLVAFSVIVLEVQLLVHCVKELIFFDDPLVLGLLVDHLQRVDLEFGQLDLHQLLALPGL